MKINMHLDHENVVVKYTFNDKEKEIMKTIYNNNQITFKSSKDLQPYQSELIDLFQNGIIEPYKGADVITYIFTEHGLNISKLY